MRKYIYIYLILGLAVAACNTLPDAEVELGPLYPLSGEWWVSFEYDDGSGTIADHDGFGYTRLYTFNTADNTADSMWVTDMLNENDDDNYWEFKVKAGVSKGEKAFSIPNGKDLIWADNTTIANGQVIERVDGDSIYMEVEWASDPGTIYYCSGRRVKGFLDGTGGTSYYADYGD